MSRVFRTRLTELGYSPETIREMLKVVGRAGLSATTAVVVEVGTTENAASCRLWDVRFAEDEQLQRCIFRPSGLPVNDPVVQAP
jgi:hypothetical protein